MKTKLTRAHSVDTRKAFTLIELLVVIAIIAILAAILFPVFAQAREKARQTMCLSNLKQIGLAVMQYNQDNDEAYPYANAGTPAFGWDWTYAVGPYVKAGSSVNSNGYSLGAVWQCPSNPHPRENGQYKPLSNIMPYGYGTNPMPNPTRMSQIDHPSDQLMIFECGTNFPTDGQWGYVAAQTTAEWFWTANAASGASIADQYDCDSTTANAGNWQGCNTYPRYRHGSVCNMLWADGHAKALHKGQLSWYKNVYIPAVDGSSYW